MRNPVRDAAGSPIRRTVVGALFLVTAVGCSGWRPLTEPRPIEGSTATYWVPRARVTLARNETIMLRGITLTPDSLMGTAPDAVVHRYARRDVARIEQQHFHRGRSTALVVLSAFVALSLFPLFVFWGMSE